MTCDPKVYKQSGSAQHVIVDNFPVDYEYITNTICNPTTDTWHFITTPYADGVAGTPIDIDSGVSCSEPQPLDIELFDVDTCVNGLLVREIRQKNYDELGNAAPSTLIETFNTGIECNTSDLVEIKGEDCEGNSVVEEGFYVKHLGKIQADLCSGVDTETQKFLFCENGVQKQAIIEKQASFIDGSTIVNWALTTIINENGVATPATTLPVGATLGACPILCPITREVYRIDGTTTGTSTDLRGGGGVVGNTVTISAPFKSIGTNILRQTMQDPGDGSIAKIEVDGVEYHMGAGNAYFTDIMDWGTNDCSEEYTQDITFTATGEAHLEIAVTYK